MDSDNRPNAALINREWFDAARSIMSVQDLGIVLVRACEYVFGSETFDLGGETQKVVFAMIRPALDSDIVKYRERCARNAANARSGSQRVAASGSEWQRVGANTTTTTTSTTTTTTTPSISPERSEEIEKWLIYGYFWSIGSKAIKEECTAFWSYYESLGWKNNKGAPIVSKLAAARMWKRQFELGAVPNGADAWFRAVQTCKTPDYNVFAAYMGAERTDAGIIVRLRCNSTFYEGLISAVPDLEKTLKGIWRAVDLKIETAC